MELTMFSSGTCLLHGLSTIYATIAEAKLNFLLVLPWAWTSNGSIDPGTLESKLAFELLLGAHLVQPLLRHAVATNGVGFVDGEAHLQEDHRNDSWIPGLLVGRECASCGLSLKIAVLWWC